MRLTILSLLILFTSVPIFATKNTNLVPASQKPKLSCLRLLTLPTKLEVNFVPGVAFADGDRLINLSRPNSILRIGSREWISLVRVKEKDRKLVGFDSRIYTTPPGYVIDLKTVQQVGENLIFGIDTKQNLASIYSGAKSRQSNKITVITIDLADLVHPQITISNGSRADLINSSRSAEPAMQSLLGRVYEHVNRDSEAERWFKGKRYSDVGPGVMAGEWRAFMRAIQQGQYLYVYFHKEINNSKRPEFNSSASMDDQLFQLGQRLNQSVSEVTVARVNLDADDKIQTVTRISMAHLSAKVIFTGDDPLEIFMAKEIDSSSYQDGRNPGGDKSLVKVQMPNEWTTEDLSPRAKYYQNL